MSAIGAGTGRMRTASPARPEQGTRVRVDDRSIASEGSVSVIDLVEDGGASVPRAAKPPARQEPRPTSKKS